MSAGELAELLGLAAQRSASDLHLVAGQRPVVRVHGALTTLEEWPELEAERLLAYLAQMTTPAEQQEFTGGRELDFRFQLPGVAFLRGNAAWQQGAPYLTLRLLPTRLLTLAELELPPICADLALRPRGLIVVAGPANSGKSTTLAAMVEHINSQAARRIVTVEDPIEYVFTSRRSLIVQREVGRDTASFARALRAVLRQDPDVLLVGEMRDAETMAAALTAAETGHLVLTTVHAPSAPQAVDRILDVFPPHQQAQVRSQLAAVLEAVLYQALLPRCDGRGRTVAVEVLLGTTPVRALIREAKGHQLPNALFTGAAEGMCTLNQALAALCRRGVVAPDRAAAASPAPGELERLLGARTGV